MPTAVKALTGITGSPFVSAFTAVGIPYGASIMNLVVITAALSSSNTDLYLSTRMLFSLSRGRYAPEWLGRLSENGVLRRALAPERIARLPMRLRFFPYSTWLGIAALFGIAVSTFYVQGLQYSVPAFAPIVLLISLAYWKVRRGKGFARGMERQ